MIHLPDTASRKRPQRRTLPPLILLLVFLAAVLLAPVLMPERDPVPDGDPAAAGMADVVVSAEDRAAPPSHTGRFGGRPDAVFVYVVAEGNVAGLRAEVGRSGRTSLLGRLLPGIGLEVRQRPTRAPGVMKFAVSATGGEPLPTGRYDVTLYAGEGTSVAARSFSVGDTADDR